MARNEIYLRCLLAFVLTTARSTETFGELKTKISAFQKACDVFLLGDLFGSVISGTSWPTTNNTAQW